MGNSRGSGVGRQNITQLLSNAEDMLAGLLTDSWFIVQNPGNGPDRDPRLIRDLANRGQSALASTTLFTKQV